MGLIANVFIIAVIVIAILFAVSYLSQGAKQSLTNAQAIAQVTEFIKSSFPNSVRPLG